MASTAAAPRKRQYVTNFQPQLRTETAQIVPEPIFIAALIGTARLRLVELPAEVWRVSTDDRNRLVKQAIRDHYRAHKRHVVPFGAILSYTLVTMPGYLVDDGFPYDTAGNLPGRCTRSSGSGKLSVSSPATIG
jgi:hypothetical protein